MPDRRTAILFFSHRPEREWQNKQFVRQDYAKHRQVAASFYEHSREAVRESGFPVLEINGVQQRGSTFGERLANAFADAFAEGYERVIAVGSDCPRLHEVDWQAVAARLGKGVPVLGPTPDRDGTYLIGLSRTQFDRRAFAALPWKSPALFSALARHLVERAGSAPVLLRARDDVNDHEEFLALLHQSPSLPQDLLTRLRAVLGGAGHVEGGADLTPDVYVWRPRSRAPPSVSTG